MGLPSPFHWQGADVSGQGRSEVRLSTEGSQHPRARKDRVLQNLISEPLSPQGPPSVFPLEWPTVPLPKEMWTSTHPTSCIRG